MRVAIAFSIVCSVIFLGSAAVTAAPLALSDHAAATKTAGSAEAMVETVAKRRKARRSGRRYKRGCTWQCRPYWRPYQYRYWQFYFPHGGPLF